MSGLPAAPRASRPHRAAHAPDLRYAGLATRVVSFLVDAALITLVDVVVGVGAALILSLLHIPHGLRTILAVLGAIVFVLGSILLLRGLLVNDGPDPRCPRDADPSGSRRRSAGQAAVGGGRAVSAWCWRRCRCSPDSCRSCSTVAAAGFRIGSRTPWCVEAPGPRSPTSAGRRSGRSARLPGNRRRPCRVEPCAHPFRVMTGCGRFRMLG